MFESTRYNESDDTVNDTVDRIVPVGSIGSSLTTVINYDAVFFRKAAMESIEDTADATAIVSALEDQTVQTDASTVILQQYNFSAESRAKHRC